VPRATRVIRHNISDIIRCVKLGCITRMSDQIDCSAGTTTTFACHVLDYGRLICLSTWWTVDEIIIFSFIHHKVEKEKYKYIYNIHKYSIITTWKKQRRKLMTKHGIKDQLWQQKYQVIQTKTLQIVTFTHLRGEIKGRCRIYLFSFWAARVYNKLTRYGNRSPLEYHFNEYPVKHAKFERTLKQVFT